MLVNELLRPKYNKIKFYCHNLGGYDVVFILKALIDFNETSQDKYDIQCIHRDDKIIKLTIKKDGMQFNIFDSYCMLNDKLSNLAKNFEVDTFKSTFPYKFARKDTLFYTGNTPNIFYYNNI